MTNVARVALLVVVWLLAWGELSLANLASGVAVAVALLLAFPPARAGRSRRRLHPSALGTARLAVYVAGQLVTSNVTVAREIVRRRTTLRPGVLAHRLQHPSDEVVTVMTSVIALSPGTMTVDVAPDGMTIYVHFLLLHDVAAARAALVRLEKLVTGALGAPFALEARS